MAEEIKDPLKIVMQGDGKMEWKFPEGGNLPRFQAYEILGMCRYVEHTLLKMLQQPIEKEAQRSALRGGDSYGKES